MGADVHNALKVLDGGRFRLMMSALGPLGLAKVEDTVMMQNSMKAYTSFNQPFNRDSFRLREHCLVVTCYRLALCYESQQYSAQHRVRP